MEDGFLGWFFSAIADGGGDMMITPPSPAENIRMFFLFSGGLGLRVYKVGIASPSMQGFVLLLKEDIFDVGLNFDLYRNRDKTSSLWKIQLHRIYYIFSAYSDTEIHKFWSRRSGWDSPSLST